jgi:L,D-transpeptidase catalytic domain
MNSVNNLFFNNPNPMRNSAPRLIAFVIIIVSPFFMAGKNAPLPYSISSSSYFERFIAFPEERNNVSVAEQLYENIQLHQFGLDQKIFSLAMKGFSSLSAKNLLTADSILSIIDFSKSSRLKRFLVIDLKNEVVLFHTVVAHGKKSGMEFAKSFSNKSKSLKSSLGFYITGNSYLGSNGYSMKLEGLEKGINDKALARAIVMHGADYANEQVIERKGYLGRSYGCPAVPESINRDIVDKIKNGNCLFIYSNDKKYLTQSKLLNG